MTSQQSADAALQKWQELRNAGLTDEQRIERMFAEFFAPPPTSSIEFDITMRKVHEEMQHV
jgi:hypothetical protein